MTCDPEYPITLPECPDPCDKPCGDDTLYSGGSTGTDNGGTTMNPDTYPGTALRWGSSGVHVVNMQTRLNRLATVYTAINTQTGDGKFGHNMYNAVLRFQKQHGLAADGIIGRQTWERIVAIDNAQTGGGYTNVTTPYPGYVI